MGCFSRRLPNCLLMNFTLCFGRQLVPGLVLPAWRMVGPTNHQFRSLARQTESFHSLFNSPRLDDLSAFQIRHQKGEITDDVDQARNSIGIEEDFVNSFGGKNLSLAMDDMEAMGDVLFRLSPRQRDAVNVDGSS